MPEVPTALVVNSSDIGQCQTSCCDEHMGQYRVIWMTSSTLHKKV